MKLSCVGFMVLAFLNLTGPVIAESDRPNVVLILIDDLSHYGVTAYGANRISDTKNNTFTNVEIETPNIDRLARGGLRCDRAFAYPLCESTRIALMSGQYNSRNYLAPKAQHASDITFGDTFKRAGYRTGIFGKWKQTRGTKEIPGKDYIFEFGWDEFCCFDVVDEGQRFINPLLVINGERVSYKNRQDTDPTTGRRWYGPDICNRYALDFIDRNKNVDSPFFLYYPMILVHDEHKPTPDTRPKSEFDECDESKQNDDFKYFPDMLAYMDKLVGKVVRKLEQHDLRKNTLIVLMGDNGTKEPFAHILPDGKIFQGNKGATKTNGLQVPLIFSWPGKLPSAKENFRRYDGLTDVVDIYPTIAQAAGVDIPNRAGIDGISFWDQILGRDQSEHRDAIYTWYNANNPVTDPTHVVRYAFDKNFKRYAPHKDFPAGRFFDLRSDPFEDAGEKKVMLRWGHFYKAGLPLNALNDERQAAYRRLGAVIEKHQYVPVTDLEIQSLGDRIKSGARYQMKHRVLPENATRQNVVWTSSNPSVATIDKFGELRALKAGKTTIAIYSWEDASPLAKNLSETFVRNGIQARIDVEVTND